MRRWLKLIAVFTAGLTGGLLASSALSQTVLAYPNKPVRIIAPFVKGQAPLRVLQTAPFLAARSITLGGPMPYKRHLRGV